MALLLFVIYLAGVGVLLNNIEKYKKEPFVQHNGTMFICCLICFWPLVVLFFVCWVVLEIVIVLIHTLFQWLVRKV